MTSITPRIGSSRIPTNANTNTAAITVAMKSTSCKFRAVCAFSRTSLSSSSARKRTDSGPKMAATSVEACANAARVVSPAAWVGIADGYEDGMLNPNPHVRFRNNGGIGAAV